MSTPDDGGPAYPSRLPKNRDQHLLDNINSGMTLRDWFAGQALSGMMAYQNPSRGDFHTNCDDETISKCAYSYADAMIAARNNLP